MPDLIVGEKYERNIHDTTIVEERRTRLNEKNLKSSWVAKRQYVIVRRP
jgi:hypothetical protein